MNTKENVLIFSVGTEKHHQTLRDLKSQGVPAIGLIGKEKGLYNLSILVIGFQHIDTVERIAKDAGQDSYLKSHNDRFTERVSLKKAHVEPVGYLKPVSEEGAWLKGTYTRNPQTNTFYTLEARP